MNAYVVINGVSAIIKRAITLIASQEQLHCEGGTMLPLGAATLNESKY